MAGSAILTLGSPIKDNLAPSMLGPTTTSGTLTSGVTTSGITTSGITTSGVTTSGLTTASGTLAAGTSTAAKAASIGIFGSLFYTAVFVGVGYLGYRSAKALWRVASEKAAEA